MKPIPFELLMPELARFMQSVFAHGLGIFHFSPSELALFKPQPRKPRGKFGDAINRIKMQLKAPKVQLIRN